MYFISIYYRVDCWNKSAWRNNCVEAASNVVTLPKATTTTSETVRINAAKTQKQYAHAPAKEEGRLPTIERACCEVFLCAWIIIALDALCRNKW